MAKWGYVSNGSVEEAYDALPENWRNISNFYLYENDPSGLIALGWYPVVDVTQPLDPLTETYGPVEYTWDIQQALIFQQAPVIPSPNPITPEQWWQMQRDSFLRQLDSQRLQKLQASDWTQLGDVILEHDQAWVDSWRAYRSQVRNIVSVYSNPPYQDVIDINQVVWPLEPAP